MRRRLSVPRPWMYGSIIPAQKALAPSPRPSHATMMCSPSELKVAKRAVLLAAGLIRVQMQAQSTEERI